MSNVYTITLPDGSTRLLTERTIRDIGGLTLHGRNRVLYGQQRNQNLILLATNFASNIPPAGSPGPLIGQIWYDTSTSQLNVWNGSAWVGVGGGGSAGLPAAGDGLITIGSPVTAYAVDSTVVRTTGAQTIGGIKTFSDPTNFDLGTVALPGIRFNGDTNTGIYRSSPDVLGITAGGAVCALFGTEQILGRSNGTVSDPPFSFISDPDTGMYNATANTLSFVTGGTQRLQIQSDGTLAVTTVNYENLVTADDDIPNKKYVDDLVDDPTIVRTTGNQTVGGTKTFSDPVRFASGTVSAPSITFSGDVNTGMYNPNPDTVGISAGGDDCVYFTGQQIRGRSDGTQADPPFSFIGDPDTGMYNSAANQLSFATGGIQRFRIEPNGVLRSTNTIYETLVTDDDDIPNKKYVDDNLNNLPTFSGTDTITGLNDDKKYLVSVYGVTGTLAGGADTIGGVRVGTGTTVGSGTTIENTGSTALTSGPGGQIAQSHSFVCQPNATSINGAVDWINASTFTPALSMYAVEIGDENLPPPAAGTILLNDRTGPNFVTGRFNGIKYGASDPDSASVTLTFQNNGDFVVSYNLGATQFGPSPATGEWGSGVTGGDYTIEGIEQSATGVTTTFTTGALALSSNRSYTVNIGSISGFPNVSGIATFQFIIREALSSVIRATAIIEVRVELNTGMMP